MYQKELKLIQMFSANTLCCYPRKPPQWKYQEWSNRICHFSTFSCLNTGSSCCMTSSLKEMVAAKRVADGQTTHPLPPRGLYVTLYKAFLSASQARCVYTARGAYPWHRVFQARWHFRGSAAIGGSGRKIRGRHTVPDLWISAQRVLCFALLLNDSGLCRT